MNFAPASSVLVHLTGSALLRAKVATAKAQGIRAALRFKGPHFRGNDNLDIDVAVGSTTLNVQLREAGSDNVTEYVYPLNTVGRIRIKG